MTSFSFLQRYVKDDKGSKKLQNRESHGGASSFRRPSNREENNPAIKMENAQHNMLNYEGMKQQDDSALPEINTREDIIR